MDGRVLTIAGSDSGGGAGIQADIKTITALGGYAMSAITSLTAQNTFGVQSRQDVDPFFVEAQAEAAITDIGVDAVKVGMLGSRTTAELVARLLERLARSAPCIVDPLCRSTSGQLLLDPDAQATLKERLIPLAAVVTPNALEAEALTGVVVDCEQAMHRAADHLLLLGAGAVLVTGGHLASDSVVDILRTADGEFHRFEGERLETRARHGTGCTLSSGVATGLAQGLTLAAAVERAVRYTQDAMRWAHPLGRGPEGPLDHGHTLRLRPPEAPVH